METRVEMILKTKKISHLLRDIENEKLYHLVNHTVLELNNLKTDSPAEMQILRSAKEKFNLLPDRILALIKKESNFILPYIDKLLEKAGSNASDTYIVYSNLTIPLKMLIIEQSKIMDQLEELKGLVFSGTACYTEGKVLLALIEIAQLFEKHIFISQRMLIPSLVQLI